jgi:two-component system, NarL family, sensor histidine kinase DevS
MLTGSELWLLRLMADRGLALVDASGLILVVEQSGELQVAAASGNVRVGVRVLPTHTSALGAVYLAGESLELQSPRGPDAAWLHELGVEARAIVVEPLRLEPLGGGLVIALRQDGRFRGADREALRAFAASVAQRLAAERSVEIERIRHGLAERERERTRWARDIHDETVQGLGALRLKLANARDDDDASGLRKVVDAVLEGLGDEIDGLRHLITELRPAALDDLGLVPALAALTRRAEAVDGLSVTSEFDLGPSAERLDPELESTIYRVVQEALTNVSRHAEATHASVEVVRRGDELLAVVRDNGRGLSAAQSPAPGSTSGFGTSGMRERAELVGGRVEIREHPGGGTVVELSVPMVGRPFTGLPA